MDRLPVFRFSLRSVAVLFLGIAIGLVFSRVPSRAPSNGAPGIMYAPLDYLVEPPDVLQITVSSDHAASPVLAGQFAVAPDGAVDLGIFGKAPDAAWRSVSHLGKADVGVSILTLGACRWDASEWTIGLHRD